MRFVVKDAPEGLAVNAVNGQITGVIRSLDQKEYRIRIIAENSLGKDEKAFRIKVGDDICLTPPMGWSSWNAYGEKVSQEKVLRCARGIVEKGLINYGWTYVNVDDVWQAPRGGPYNAIQPNDKFPDMKGLVKEIHQLGLKAGIYSTPWVGTFAGCPGGSADTGDGLWKHPHYQIPLSSDAYPLNWKARQAERRFGNYHFEQNDVRQWADWGFDYLKYDWNEHDEISVLRMLTALRGCGRDIVFSISPKADATHKAYYLRYANVLRTSGDIEDTWESIKQSWSCQNQWADSAAPGRYPDADMLVVDGCWERNSRLTPDEQYTHISLWCLWSSPLILGSDMATLNDFALGLLTNPEVLAIQQDELCKMARQIALGNNAFLFRKELQDGSLAVGLVNAGETPVVIQSTWHELGLSGMQTVRDVWRQKEIGSFNRDFMARVYPHGVVLLKITKKQDQT